MDITGCKILDDMLKHMRTMLVYGEAGTGKTAILLTIARNLSIKGVKSIYISTEGYIYSARVAPYYSDYENVVFIDVDDFDKQLQLTLMTPFIRNIDCVIIDSINALYRLEAYKEYSIEKLGLILAILRDLAEKNKYVFASAQVRAVEDSEEPIASGMPILEYWFDIIINLARENGKRYAKIMKPQYKKTIIEFLIESEGVKWLGCSSLY